MMYSLATDGSGCAFRWYALLILVGILVAMVCALGAVECFKLLISLAVVCYVMYLVLSVVAAVILFGILVAMVCFQWLILAASKIIAVSLAQTIETQCAILINVVCLAMVCALGAVGCFQPRRPIREPEV